MEFSPSERCAKAVMLARAKCHVPAGTRAIQIQRVGVVKAALIPIRRREPDINQAARRNRHAAQLHILCCGTHQALHRRLEPQHLLDQDLQVAVRIRLQLLPNQWVLNQQFHTRGDRIRRSFGAADKGIGHHLGVKFVVIERTPPFLNNGIHQRAQ